MHMRTVIFFSFLVLCVPIMLEAATINTSIITPNSEVPVLTTVSFTAEPVSFSGTVQYTVSDSFPGSSVSNSHINRFGQFSWTPQPIDVGTHVLTISGLDSVGNRAQVNRTIVVTEASPVSIKSLTPGTQVLPDKPVSFSVSALGYTSPQFSVSDSFWGTSVSNGNMSVDGNFGWTPRNSDVGVHTLAVRVTSPQGRSDTVYQTITVQGIALENQTPTISVGSQAVISIKTFGLSSPTYRIYDSARGNTIDSANISDGVLRWTPTTQDIGVHTISVHATDSNNVEASAETVVRVSSGVTTVTPTQTVPSNKYVFTKNLTVGSKGTEVLELQKKLQKEGYLTATPNGYFGQQTKAAVKKYQKAKGISQLGNIGPSTRAELNR